jgi:glycosyltransferase involved in cell wall biosynthesis
MNYPVVAMVGNLTTQWKEHVTFLEIAGRLHASLPKCHFIIFGGNSNLDLTPYTRELRQMVKRLNIEECVIWADFIHDIPAIMYSMDILVHPAVTEGSGRVVMEAMTAGKPVIGVKSGGVQELIQDGVTGFLVSPKDINAFAEKISFLLENTQARRKMAEQAVVYAQLNFSSKVMMKSIVEIYNKLNLPSELTAS